ncbi:MAG: THUMP domain-containing protein [Thermoplasmatota archaeon]
MALILVRFSELGLKSERVRSRFLSRLADDIQDSLLEAGIEHIMEVKRSRIFIETGDPESAGAVLKYIPGVYSFSIVQAASSEKDRLMEALSAYGAERIREGMTYGLKVRRSGDHPYTSQQIAVEGGGAVISHLEESKVKVDLKKPDVWIEVEIRDSRAYIFDSRIRGMGGMPASSQGRTIMFMPPLPRGMNGSGLVERVELSFTLMRRRGCRVIPVCLSGDGESWAHALEGSSVRLKKGPFILDEGQLGPGLIAAASKLKAWGVIFPQSSDGLDQLPVLHSTGAPLAQFYPTASMDEVEVRDWLRRLLG